MKTKLFTFILVLFWIIGVMQTKAAAPANVEMVDLGLPSGIKWANMNVGANAPEEYGDYFAWGETTTKSTYNWSTYFDTNDGGNTFVKYKISGGKTTLDPEDDAAHVNWGAEWRMPTEAEWRELLANCTCTWTQVNGKNGYRVSATNGNSIFLPAAGSRLGSSLDPDLSRVGSDGYFWSASLCSDNSHNAFIVGFPFGNVDVHSGNREYGQSVRPVCPTPSPTTYTITFLGANGETLQSSEVAKGEMPEYTGEEPTKAATEYFSYRFSGWTVEIAPATADATYTATFTATQIAPVRFSISDDCSKNGQNVVITH